VNNTRATILFLSLLILLVKATDISAQVGTRAGAVIGGNIASASFTSSMEGVSQSTRTGLLLGGIVEFGFSDNVCLRAEPMYVQNGAAITIVYSSASPSYKEIYELEYLELPVHVKLQTGTGAVRPYIFGGPNLGILLAASVTEEIPPPVGTLEESRQSGTQDIKDEISSTNFVFDFGGGLTCDVSPTIQLQMDVRYSLGLSNIAKPPDPNDQSFQPDSWKSRDIKVLVGILFAL